MKNRLIARRSFIKTGLIFVPTYAILRPQLAMAADVVPSTYLPVQGNFVGYCGVEGGIPPYSVQHGATISPYTGSPSTITTALSGASSAGGDRYVQLGAGTFNLNAAFQIAWDRVVLRGAVDANGVPTTILNFTAGSGGGNGNGLIQLSKANIRYDLSSSMTNVDIVAGFTTAIPPRGSTRVTLASAPTTLTVGQFMFISAIQGAAGNWSDLFVARAFTQIVRCTAKPGGNDVEFSPALNADFLTGTIQVHWRTPATDLVKRSGIENLSLTRSGTAGGHYVGFLGADECWIKNCKTTTTDNGEYHVFPDGSYRCEIRHCDMSGAINISSNQYVINISRCSQFLIEDNGFHAVPNIMPMFGLNGSAFSYNYCNDFPYEAANQQWLSQIVFFHGSLNCYNLFEGNWYPANHNDNFGQPGSRNNVYLRNRMRGKDDNPSQGVPKTSNTKPFFIGAAQVNMAIAGNVLGEDGYHTTYDVTGDTDTEENATHVIYSKENGVTGLVRKGNYNTVNDAVPAGEAVGADTVAQSYLYSSRQCFMGRYPVIEPTDTFASNNTASSLLAAAYRAVNSGADPSGWCGSAGHKPSRRQGYNTGSGRRR